MKSVKNDITRTKCAKCCEQSVVRRPAGISIEQMLDNIFSNYLGTYRNGDSVVNAILVGALWCGRGDRLRGYRSKERARRRWRQRKRISIASPRPMDLPAGV